MKENFPLLYIVIHSVTSIQESRLSSLPSWKIKYQSDGNVDCTWSAQWTRRFMTCAPQYLWCGTKWLNNKHTRVFFVYRSVASVRSPTRLTSIVITANVFFKGVSAAWADYDDSPCSWCRKGWWSRPRAFSRLRHFARRFWNHTCRQTSLSLELKSMSSSGLMIDQV